MSLIISAVIIVSVLIIDLVSKSLAVQFLEGVYEPVNIIPYLINFKYVKNEGAAFGFLGDWEYSIPFFLVITSLSLIAFSFVLIRFGKKHPLLNISFALIIGGAFGNFVDRIFLGYVRDFIRFTFWDSFAIFNIADSALTVGVFLFAVYFLFYYKESHFSKNPDIEKDLTLKDEEEEKNESDS